MFLYYFSLHYIPRLLTFLPMHFIALETRRSSMLNIETSVRRSSEFCPQGISINFHLTKYGNIVSLTPTKRIQSLRTTSGVNTLQQKYGNAFIQEFIANMTLSKIPDAHPQLVSVETGQIWWSFVPMWDGVVCSGGCKRAHLVNFFYIICIMSRVSVSILAAIFSRYCM